MHCSFTPLDIAHDIDHLLPSPGLNERIPAQFLPQNQGGWTEILHGDPTNATTACTSLRLVTSAIIRPFLRVGRYVKISLVITHSPTHVSGPSIVLDPGFILHISRLGVRHILSSFPLSIAAPLPNLQAPSLKTCGLPSSWYSADLRTCVY